MTPKEHLIEALRRLCEDHGGHIAVAEEIGVNDQTLWQVLAGTKLPSGEPRGIGPQVQKKLEARFPGWSTTAIPIAPDSSLQTRPVLTIGDLAYRIGQALAGLSDSRRTTIAHLLAAQVRDEPNLDEAQAIDMLTGGVVLSLNALNEAGSNPTNAAPLGAPIAEEHRAELDALSKAAEELHENKKQSRRLSSG